MLVCKNPKCKKEYDRDDVIEKYGEGFRYGYCSPLCFTMAEADEENRRSIMKDTLEFDMKGNMASDKDNLYFLTLKFKDGCLLGFFSHSPCSTTRDQERGWVVIDPKKKEVISECETYYHGITGNDFRKWRKKQTEIHGKGTLILDEFDERWKMNE